MASTQPPTLQVPGCVAQSQDADQSMSFLGKILIQGLLQMLQPQQEKKQQQEQEQEQKEQQQQQQTLKQLLATLTRSQ